MKLKFPSIILSAAVAAMLSACSAGVGVGASVNLPPSEKTSAGESKISPKRNEPMMFAGVDKPRGIEIKENIRFWPDCPDPQVALDLYYPKEIDRINPKPCILLIHGGGWRMGDQKKYSLFAAYAASKGYVVASTTYRLLPEYELKDCVEDCQRALLWLRKHAAEFGGNADKIGVSGGSAGGHLSALLATGGGNKDLCGGVFKNLEESKVQACVAMAPITDLRTLPLVKKLGFKGDTNEAWKLSAQKYVSKDSPPMLLLHALGDRTVPLSESENLFAAYQKAGACAEKKFYDYKGHAFWNLGLNDTFKMQSWNDTIAFFDKTLKSK